MKFRLSAKWLKFGLVAHAFLFGSALPLPVVAQESDMRQVSAALDSEIKVQENKASALLYVDAASKSDIEKMLSMTSPTTRKRYGDSKLRQSYVRTQIPVFSSSKVDIDACLRTPIDDASGITGSLFTCRVNTKNQGKLFAHIVVLNEGDSYVYKVDFKKAD